MAKLADAQDLGSCGETRAGATPVARIMKYYVSSGEFEEIVLADNPEQAVISFIKRLDEREDEYCLGLIIQVSELGFGLKGKRHDNDIFFHTQKMMDQVSKELDEN